MIEINLLPQELRKKRRKPMVLPALNFEIVSEHPFAILMSGAVVLLIIVQILIFMLQFPARSQFKSLHHSHQKLIPHKRKVDGLKVEIEKMKRKVSLIDKLMARRISWAKKLNDLSDSVVPGIWLTELSLDEKTIEVPVASWKKGRERLRPSPTKRKAKSKFQKKVLKYLAISGCAYSKREEATTSIVRFIERLKQNADFSRDFSDIELGGPIKEIELEGRDVMTFKITCTFKEDRI